MHRVTITLDDDLMIDLDQIIARRGYQNRSEAIRDLARAGIQQASLDESDGNRHCVGVLVYIYDHSERQLTNRLVEASHHHHDLSQATLHVHLDHDSCMEVTVLQGRTDHVRQFGDQIVAQRGVRHGQLVLVPVDLKSEAHAHGRESAPRRRHVHAHVHRTRA
jgi:CopG family transcriptional regulator, nickel-responsive regulator